MLYILHDPSDLEEVNEKIVPLIKDREVKVLGYPAFSDFEPEDDTILLLYLSDQRLREFLPQAAEKKWRIAILPHREIKFTIKGLGISDNTEDTIREILEIEDDQKLDLLCCNGQPVFQSVNIGNVFVLKEYHQKNNFLAELTTFFTNIRKISSLTHRSFTLAADGEKIIHTSALGIIIVEHALSSLVAKRLTPESTINDGMFHVLILAPENLFEFFLFLIRSLIPRTKKIKQPPGFIGQIKTANLTITNKGPIEYTVDGEKASAEELHLQVQPEPLLLRQKSIYSGEKVAESGKKSLKIDRLPTGEKRAELIRRTLPILPRATTEEFQDLFKVLRENAEITSPYMVMMILSTLIATFGLFADSSPVIIGAMILAPIIAPIVSFSMGMVRYDVRMLKTGIKTIIAGTIVSLLFAAAVSLIIPLRIITSEVEARLSPTLLDMGIAVASGVAAAYAHAKEGIAKSLAGVAIAVALVPPLAVAGIGIGWWDWEVFSGAFLLYLTNLAGIIMFAGLTFLFLGFAPFKRAKMGLVYTFLIILLVMVPLSLSFNRIMQEANITRVLEGSTYNGVILRDVKVRFGKPMIVSLKLVGPDVMEGEKIQKIKEQIEERLEHPIILEVVSAVEF